MWLVGLDGQYIYIYKVRYIISFSDLDTFVCEHCRLSLGSRSPSSPSSRSSESSGSTNRPNRLEMFGLSISSAKFDRRVQAMFEDWEPLEQDYEDVFEEHWLMCRWCGWWDRFIDDIINIDLMREIENYPCHSRCSWCQHLNEPPWCPNNRQRCRNQLIHLLPTVQSTITATEIVERTIPGEVIRLIAEYLAKNTI